MFFFRYHLNLFKQKLMTKPLQYIIDENGNKSTILVPIKQWEDIHRKYSKLLKKVKVLTGIQQGLAEVEDARKSGKSLQSLTDFLNESNR